MPTYDYQCQKCDHEFETFQSITAAPLRKCPRCSRPALKRLIGPGGAVLFKGDGFYITDYRSESYKKAAQADTANGKPAEGKSGDAKPDDAKPGQTKPAEPAVERAKASASVKGEPKSAPRNTPRPKKA